MRPHYSPARYLIVISLLLGVWAAIPAALFLGARSLYLALFTDALVPATEPVMVAANRSPVAVPTTRAA